MLSAINSVTRKRKRTFRKEVNLPDSHVLFFVGSSLLPGRGGGGTRVLFGEGALRYRIILGLQIWTPF